MTVISVLLFSFELLSDDARVLRLDLFDLSVKVLEVAALHTLNADARWGDVFVHRTLRFVVAVFGLLEECFVVLAKVLLVNERGTDFLLEDQAHGVGHLVSQRVQ